MKIKSSKPEFKYVKNFEKSLTLAKGVLLLRCKFGGTKCETHKRVLSNKDRVTMIDELGEDGLTKVLKMKKKHL